MSDRVTASASCNPPAVWCGCCGLRGRSGLKRALTEKASDLKKKHFIIYTIFNQPIFNRFCKIVTFLEVWFLLGVAKGWDFQVHHRPQHPIPVMLISIGPYALIEEGIDYDSLRIVTKMMEEVLNGLASPRLRSRQGPNWRRRLPSVDW